MLCSGTVPPGAAPVWREGEGLVTEGAVCVGKLWLINTERRVCGRGLELGESGETGQMLVSCGLNVCCRDTGRFLTPEPGAPGPL